MAPRGARGATELEGMGDVAASLGHTRRRCFMSSRLRASLPSRRQTPLRLALITWVGVVALAGCGGGDGSSATTPVTPAPPVDGPAWFGFGRDAQHAANGAIATQDLNRISWSTPLDLAPTYTSGGALLVHYGSPVVTSHNTVVLPVKTGASGGFRVEARSGGNGGLIWSAQTDYQLPPHNWVPSYNVALTAGNATLLPGSRRQAPGEGRRRCRARGAAHGRLLRRRRVLRVPRGIRRERLHQHAAHHRRARQRLLRLHGHRGEPGRARQRRRPHRRQRQRQLDIRRDGRRATQRSPRCR